MRMTNEEFQAEVFRRSRAYQAQQRTRRRRLLTGAMAFCGCFALVIFAAARNGIGSKSNMNMTADMAEQAQKQDIQYENCEESSEAADDEAAEAEENCKDCSEAASSPANAGKAEAAGDDASWESSEEAEAPAAPDLADFADMTDTELFDYYGISGLPETLCGLTYTGSCWYDGESGSKQPSGIRTRTDGTAEDANAFSYAAADGSEPLYVLITSFDQNTASQSQEKISYVLDNPARKVAVMTVKGLFVSLIADETVSEEDFCTASETVRAYLIQ